MEGIHHDSLSCEEWLKLAGHDKNGIILHYCRDDWTPLTTLALLLLLLERCVAF